MPRQFRPELPTFDSVEEKRKDQKEHLVAAFRIFADCGFSEGIAEHITARDPEHPELFWVNPFGRHFGLERLVEGDGPVNTAAIIIHAAVHEARPDAVASAHAHSLYGKAWASLGRLLDPITQDACRFYKDHALFDDYTGVVLKPEEGKRLAHALAGHKALILRNHGLLTVGGSVVEAAWWFVTMERSSQAQLIAEATGTPIRIDHDLAMATQREVGNRQPGWFAFQTLYDRVIQDHPDLLD